MGFQVGDVVIGVGFVNSTDRNGMEGCVIEPLSFRKNLRDKVTFHISSYDAVRGHWADDAKSCVAPHLLRLKRPPDEFQKADEDFCEWLASVRKVKV